MVLDVEVVPVPSAPLGASDATRRWGILCADGHTRWPGVTLLQAQMNDDLLTDDLKKKRASNESFWLICQSGGGRRSLLATRAG